MRKPFRRSLILSVTVTTVLMVGCDRFSNKKSTENPQQSHSMEQLPRTKDPLVIRTDFSSQDAWESLCGELRKPADGFSCNVEFLDDVQYKDVSKDKLMGLLPPNHEHSFIIIVDGTSITHPDSPLLIVDLYDERGREFRAVPSQIQAIENNLSIANTDFYEFADSVDKKGVFRGFPE